jgi:hypothetical protein
MPGAPDNNQTTQFTTVISDDTQSQIDELFVQPLPYKVEYGYLVLLESGNPDVEQAAWNNNGTLHPELWSDLVKFMNISENGVAKTYSFDGAASYDAYLPETEAPVVFISEAPGTNEGGGAGQYTDYIASRIEYVDGNFFYYTNTYHIESVIPEPATLFLLTLGSLFLRKKK